MENGDIHMHEQDHFSERDLNVHELLNDLQYIDNQMRAIKADLKYVLELLAAFDREFQRVREEALCPL